MNKFLVGFAVLIASSPVIAIASTSSAAAAAASEGPTSGASAKEYFGPYCFESPVDFKNIDQYNFTNLDQYQKTDPKHVRGTCTKIQTTTVISLDPALQKDYFLGFHEPVCYGGGFGRPQIIFCSTGAHFSELITLQGLPSLQYDTSYFNSLHGVDDSTVPLEEQHPPFTGIEEQPSQIALFEKSFFAPKLGGLVLSPAASTTVLVSVLNKSEIDEAYKKYSGMNYQFGYRYEGAASTTGPMDVLTSTAYFQNADGTQPSSDHLLKTLNYQEYGKHIFGPQQGILRENKYVSIEGNSNMFTANKLNIVTVFNGSDFVPVAPISNSLKDIKNYWFYTKKDGKLVLAWQKTEYTLNNGTIKTITASDTNVNAALLFNSVSASATATATPSVASESKKGFLASLIDWILSWF